MTNQSDLYNWGNFFQRFTLVLKTDYIDRANLQYIDLPDVLYVLKMDIMKNKKPLLMRLFRHGSMQLEEKH